MQSAENEVAGLGRSQCEPDRLEITQLADEDDVRVLAQGRPQGLVETQRIAMHLALVDQRLLGFVYELDRVLDRQYVIGLVLVDVIDHRGKCRRLARAGRPGD